MGGGDEALFYPTDEFVLKAPRKWYRIQVKSQHWQLRSLISAERPNTLYFPGGAKCTHILKLNTETQEYETVRVLSFSPRCLVAQNGWVCCGGETGEFAAVPLDGNGSSNDVDMTLDLNPDARLPIDFDSAGGDGATVAAIMSRAVRGTSNKIIIAKSKRLARDRVNCITLWFPPADGYAKHPGAYTEPVAVLANNDKTVIIVRLRDFETSSIDNIEPLDVITYPDYVNRALVSPDGRLLVAILDDPYLYIRERQEKNPRRGPYKPSTPVEWEWEYRDRHLLRSQKRDDQSESRGSFAACFSGTGAYLAVGTQYGTISIFDTTGFTDSSRPAFITSFKSSRPGTGPGAIRDMSFCPGPYELLAWTEDRGHIGIADVRSHFVYRQVIDVSEQSDFEGLSCIDRNSIDPRLLDVRQERETLASSISSSLNLASRRSQQQRTTTAAAVAAAAAATTNNTGGSGSDHRVDSPFSHDDTTVLEALQDESRRRRNQRATLRDPTLGLTTRYLDTLRNMPTARVSLSPWSERNARRGQQGGSSSANAGNTADGPAAATAATATATTADNARARERDRERANNQAQALAEFLTQQQVARQLEERRNNNNNQTGSPGSGDNNSGAPAQADTRTAGAAAALGLGGGDRNSDEIDRLYEFAIENLYESARNERDPSRRERALFLAWGGRDDDESGRRGNSSDFGAHQAPTQPDNLSGLSWSQDGRILYIAAQNGIYEFHINTMSRKYYPSMSMR